MVLQDNKKLPRPSWNDRVSRWIQADDTGLAAARHDVAELEPSSDAGLLSDLHRECLIIIEKLRSTSQCTTVGAALERAQGISLAKYSAELNLWGDILCDGSLETTLRFAPDLRQTILDNLAKIGHALVQCEISYDKRPLKRRE